MIKLKNLEIIAIGIIMGMAIDGFLSKYSTNYIPHPKKVDPGDVALSIMRIVAKDLDSTGIKEPYLIYDKVAYRIRFQSDPRGVYLERVGDSDILK